MALTIFCDESKSTGPNLLDELRYYVCSSVAMPHDPATKIQAELRTAIFYAAKRFGAASKFFDHTFEPVLRPMKDLFYGLWFHRFVSNLLFSVWDQAEAVARELMEDDGEPTIGSITCTATGMSRPDPHPVAVPAARSREGITEREMTAVCVA